MDACLRESLVLVALCSLSEGPMEILQRASFVTGLQQNRWYAQLPVSFLCQFCRHDQWNLLIHILPLALDDVAASTEASRREVGEKICQAADRG